MLQRISLDRSVDGPLVSQFALGQPELLDSAPSDVSSTVANELRHGLLRSPVVHPGERDVRCELVPFGFVTQIGRSLLDGLVETPQFVASVVDTEPGDADVLRRRERAQSAKGKLERAGIGRLDGRGERVVESVEVVTITGTVAEKLDRHVGLSRVDRGNSRPVRDRFLYGFDFVLEAVEIDADEQSHATSTPPDGKTARARSP